MKKKLQAWWRSWRKAGEIASMDMTRTVAVEGILTIPSGKHTKNDGKSLFLMGKSTINGDFQ
jgi:hypothetical protein